MLRRKTPEMLTSLPTWLMISLGVGLLAGFMALLWIVTDTSRTIAGFSIFLLVICIILAVSRLRWHFDKIKCQKNEHTHHGE